LAPQHPIEQARGVAAQSAQQCLTRRTFDDEVPDAAKEEAIGTEEVEIERLGLGLTLGGAATAVLPSRVAVELLRRPLAERHPLVLDRQEQARLVVRLTSRREQARSCDARA